MREIIIPGEARQYSLAQIHIPGEVDEALQNRRLYTPTDSSRATEDMDYFNAIIEQVDVATCERRVNPFSGEYEFIAPDGYEFVMTGKMLLENDGPDDYGPPGYSEQYLADFDEHSNMKDVEPFGSEFRGKHLTIDVGGYGHSYNPRKTGKHEKFSPRSTTTREGRPRSKVIVRGPTDFEWTAIVGQTLPFNLEGQPKTTTIPENVMMQKKNEVSGRVEDIEITIVQCEDKPVLVTEIPRSTWADDTSKPWLPNRGLTMEEEFAIPGQEGMKEYKMSRVGGTEADLYAYYRRMGSPYADDPLYNAKNLVDHVGFNGDMDETIAKAVVEMPVGNENRIAAEELLTGIVGSIALVESAQLKKDGKDRIDPEPF